MAYEREDYVGPILNLHSPEEEEQRARPTEEDDLH